MMPVLKFETKLINGRPNIIFETENQKNISKKRNYKTKVQKYPLRNTDGKIIDEISEENINNNVGQEKTKANIYKSRRRSHSPVQSRNIDVDIDDISNKRNVTDNSNKKQSKVQKESLFNFLKADQKEYINDTNNLERKSIKINNKEKKPLSDKDIDDIMKEVVLKNKDILTDDQLVDLLAKIYIEAKKGCENEELPKHAEIKSNNKQYSNSKENFDFVPSLDIENSISVVPKVPPPKLTENPLPLTMAQKKQLQWDQERKELEKITSYNPWGRPGCGAPPRDTYEVSTNENYQSHDKDIKTNTEINGRILSARTPEVSGLSQTEIKRRQWLSELNEQVAEKEKSKFQVNHRPTLISDHQIHLSGDISPGHGRGKGLANLNQVTSDELIMKRHKQIEQQEAIKRQIEEKELIKRLEREKKALLDQQEEMRINKEKQQLESQYLNETSRVKQKEDESGRRFALLRTQVEEAERAALLDKRMKRLQHLELAGHDTRQLRAGLVADQITGRLAASTEFLSDDKSFNNFRQDQESLNEKLRTRRIGYPITEDQGIQTDIEDDYKRRDYNDYDSSRNHKEYRNRSVEVGTKDIRTTRRMKTYKKDELDKEMKDKKQIRLPSATFTKQEENMKPKRPESIGTRKPWGVKKLNKKYIPQSKRDPFYASNKNERENNKHERVNKILAQVKANLDRIPDTEVVDGHLSQRHKRCDDRNIHEHNKENMVLNQGTYELRDRNILQFEDENDRVQASVRYKDSYKQPANKRSHPHPGDESQRNVWTPQNQSDLWDNSECEIVRTTDILDPTRADQKCLVSRENTGRERARQSYFKSQNPGQLGNDIDRQYNHNMPHRSDQDKQNLLSYPPGHPTNRQNTILKQLSDIREDLRMRQKEIETSFNGDF